MGRSKLGSSEVASNLEETKRRVRRELERLIEDIEFSSLSKDDRRKTLRDLFLAVETVRSIRAPKVSKTQEEPKKTEPRKPILNRVERSND